MCIRDSINAEYGNLRDNTMEAAADARTQMEAFAFRKLVAHLQMRTDVQNIDLMNLSGFCRNCLSKWLHAGAKHVGTDLTYEEACMEVYSMPVKEWKSKHQTPATPEQMALYEASKPNHATEHDAMAPSSTLPARLHSDVCCSDDQPAAVGSAAAPAYSGPVVPIKLGVLTVSDRAFNKVYEDLSGPAILESMDAYASQAGKWELTVSEQAVVPDEQDQISSTLEQWSDTCNLVLTTGGTGFSARDVTPEATKHVSHKLATGLMHKLQLEATRLEPMAAASRAVIGVRGGCVIVNLPGRPAAVRQNLSVLMPMIGHVISQLSRDSPQQP
eukprot:TRINITY_DN13034_c0_g1_i1.p1 TRINITY_DN13034_c0_g1~~TRINITY_DN13034_c0_g1_i1.p1  ORF type:complete len:329 (-),score=76.51 TRINITY_DN13034_c0_g1_i1:216-1202(-)